MLWERVCGGGEMKLQPLLIAIPLVLVSCHNKATSWDPKGSVFFANVSTLGLSLFLGGGGMRFVGS